MKRPMGRLAPLTIGDAPSLLTSEEPFCACVVGEVSLTSRMRDIWSFISYLGRAQLLLSPAILEHVSIGDKFRLFRLGPIYLLPQDQRDRSYFLRFPVFFSFLFLSFFLSANWI